MELSPAQAEKEWKAGTYRPAYYFIGEDDSAKSAAVDKLKELLKPDPFNLDEFFGDPGASVPAAVGAALMPPLMTNRRLVVLKTPKLGVEARKALAEYLGSPLETTTLILFSDDRKPDLRDVLTATVGAFGGLVVFKPLYADEAANRLEETASKSGKKLEPGVAELLVDEIGTDWGILQAELGKMILFARGKDMIGRQDALACLGYRRTANPFDLPRTIQARDRTASMRLLQRLLMEGEEPLRILYQISSTLNKQLRAKKMKAAGLSEEQIFRELRLQSYYDRDFMRLASRVSEATLISQLKACLRLETALKSEVWLDGRIELERLVAGICAPAKAPVTP